MKQLFCKHKYKKGLEQEKSFEGLDYYIKSFVCEKCNKIKTKTNLKRKISKMKKEYLVNIKYLIKNTEILPHRDWLNE